MTFDRNSVDKEVVRLEASCVLIWLCLRSDSCSRTCDLFGYVQPKYCHEWLFHKNANRILYHFCLFLGQRSTLSR